MTDEAIKLFGCDTARITSPMSRHYLVIGWKENSVGWKKNGKRFNFEYIREEVIASGVSLRKLRESMLLEIRRPPQCWHE